MQRCVNRAFLPQRLVLRSNYKVFNQWCSYQAADCVHSQTYGCLNKNGSDVEEWQRQGSQDGRRCFTKTIDDSLVFIENCNAKAVSRVWLQAYV